MRKEPKNLWRRPDQPKNHRCWKMRWDWTGKGGADRWPYGRVGHVSSFWFGIECYPMTAQTRPSQRSWR